MDKSEFEFCWSDHLTVGDPGMDREHRQIIARFNELNRAVIECHDKNTVHNLIVLMWIQVAIHFGREQLLLAKWRYPDRAAHAEKHLGLAAAYHRLMKEVEEADVSFVWALKALRFERLLVEHLLNEDMKYRDFLQGKKHAIPRIDERVAQVNASR